MQKNCKVALSFTDNIIAGNNFRVGKRHPDT